MIHNEFVLFLKKYNIYDEEIYRYYLENANRFDYYNDDFLRNFIGCSLIIDNKHNGLKQIIPTVPYPVDDVTTLINIHEYVHLFSIYNKLGKKYKKDISEEVLPIFYEKLFVLENGNSNLNNYEKQLDEIALKENDERYLLALKISQYLLDSLNVFTFNELVKVVKKVRKKIR